MNLLLLRPEELEPLEGAALEEAVDLDSKTPPDGRYRAELRGERARHLVKVLGVEPGRRVIAGVEDGWGGDATVQRVEKLDSGEHVVAIEVELTRKPPAALDVKLVLALPRPKFLGRILQWATTMGVRQIHLIGSARVEKSYWSSSLLAPAALRRHLALGLEQGRDTIFPRLLLEAELSRFVSEQLPSLRRDGPVWLAHQASERPWPATPSTPATVCVGPEGGWLDDEVEALVEGGARPRHLGERPLRVEAAVAVCVGRFLGT